MHKYWSPKDVVDDVDRRWSERALRRNGFDLSVREICDLVASGDCDERRAVVSRLVAVSDDEPIMAVLVAAYSRYVDGLVLQTKSELDRMELWAIGLEALVRSIRSAARCGAGHFHIVKSVGRDFVRVMHRHRLNMASDRLVGEALAQQGWSTSFEDELSVVSVNELVGWIATEFRAGERLARVIVETRLGGFNLGGGTTSTERSQNCRDRNRIETEIRGFVSPAEGLAEHVLSLAS